jgi:4-hydroxybenzoate polyprenyltransferase
MKQLRLAETMLRYRTAALLLPFFLLAPALHGRLQSFRWAYLAALIALFASFVVATCLNDIFDVDIDRINHVHARERPLVTGDATPRELLILAAALALVALAAAAASGPQGIALIVLSLVVNVAYSVPPVRLCTRALAAPLVLAFAYVALPYGIGLASAGIAPGWFDLKVAASFYALFAGRMLLKDFRDRRGDAAFDKRTFLLTYGKRATLVATLVCIVVGDALLLTVLPTSLLLLAAIESYFVAIALQLYRLWTADTPEDERVAIAMGARMGNAVVLTLLGFVLLQAAGAARAEQGVFVVALALMFWFVYAYLATRPQEAVTAYRG